MGKGTGDLHWEQLLKRWQPEEYLLLADTGRTPGGLAVPTESEAPWGTAGACGDDAVAEDGADREAPWGEEEEEDLEDGVGQVTP